MNFDSFTAVLLLTPAAPPELDEEAAGAIQDQHLNFLAELHESGKLLAAGPLLDPGRKVRGLSLFKADLEETRVLVEQDPAVQAEVFEVQLLPWLVPAGALKFATTRFPHSRADVGS
ncbi:MAG: hypothetical protein QOG93_34 [Gaiellaceae bacterium]|nr:hypothetical protein [Gaiellaceae bacterium]